MYCVLTCRQDLKSLVYLKYCIKETIRLYPPVAGVGRVLSKATEIDGHAMPAHTPMLCMIYAVHHNPDVWEKPEVRIHSIRCVFCSPIIIIIL